MDNIKTFENFDLTNIYKYFVPSNILYKLNKYGIRCEYYVSEFDRYVKLFYTTSPILKEIEIGQRNSVKLYRKNDLLYEIYTVWTIGRNRREVDIILHVKDINYKKNLYAELDPLGEENWDDDTDDGNNNSQKISCDGYKEALEKVLEIEKLKKR